jgi:hypothetical protein
LFLPSLKIGVNLQVFGEFLLVPSGLSPVCMELVSDVLQTVSAFADTPRFTQLHLTNFQTCAVFKKVKKKMLPEIVLAGMKAQ